MKRSRFTITDYAMIAVCLLCFGLLMAAAPLEMLGILLAFGLLLAVAAFCGTVGNWH